MSVSSGVICALISSSGPYVCASPTFVVSESFRGPDYLGRHPAEVVMEIGVGAEDGYHRRGRGLRSIALVEQGQELRLGFVTAHKRDAERL